MESMSTVRWLNAFSGRCNVERKCDRCLNYCIHCALFAYAILLDRYPPRSVPIRYLFWHVCWARAIKLLRLTWQCPVTFALGYLIGQRSFHRTTDWRTCARMSLPTWKKTTLQNKLRPGLPQANRPTTSLVQGNPRRLVL